MARKYLDEARRHRRGQGDGTAYCNTGALAKMAEFAFKMEQKRILGPDWIYSVPHEVFFVTGETTSRIYLARSHRPGATMRVERGRHGFDGIEL